MNIPSKVTFHKMKQDKAAEFFTSDSLLRRKTVEAVQAVSSE